MVQRKCVHIKLYFLFLLIWNKVNKGNAVPDWLEWEKEKLNREYYVYTLMLKMKRKPPAVNKLPRKKWMKVTWNGITRAGVLSQKGKVSDALFFVHASLNLALFGKGFGLVSQGENRERNKIMLKRGFLSSVEINAFVSFLMGRDYFTYIII